MEFPFLRGRFLTVAGAEGQAYAAEFPFLRGRFLTISFSFTRVSRSLVSIP